MTQSVLSAWRCSTLHAVAYYMNTLKSIHTIAERKSRFFQCFPNTTTASHTPPLPLPILCISGSFGFCILYNWALVWVKSGGRTEVGSRALREADSRLGVKGYRAWMSGWTPSLSPVALLIFMFLVFTPLGDVPDHCIKLAWFRKSRYLVEF